MTKGIKISIGVGIPLLVIGTLYFLGRSKAKRNDCAKTNFGATIYGVPVCPKKDN